MCILAAVSRASYYRFGAPGADSDEEEPRLRDAIQRVAIESRQYGYRRSLMHCERRAGRSITSASRV